MPKSRQYISGSTALNAPDARNTEYGNVGCSATSAWLARPIGKPAPSCARSDRTNSCAAPYSASYSPSASTTKHCAPSRTAATAAAASPTGLAPTANVHAHTVAPAARISLTRADENCGSAVAPSAALTYTVCTPSAAICTTVSLPLCVSGICVIHMAVPLNARATDDCAANAGAGRETNANANAIAGPNLDMDVFGSRLNLDMDVLGFCLNLDTDVLGLR